MSSVANTCRRVVEDYLYSHYEDYLNGVYEGNEIWTKAFQAMEINAAIEEEKWALAHSRYYM